MTAPKLEHPHPTGTNLAKIFDGNPKTIPEDIVRSTKECPTCQRRYFGEHLPIKYLETTSFGKCSEAEQFHIKNCPTCKKHMNG